MKKHRLHIAVLLLSVFPLFLLINCTKTIYVESDPVNNLRQNITEILNDPGFQDSNFGIYIESLRTGEVIYSQNHHRLFMPASNMKIFTTATALVKLGPEFQYENNILVRGVIDKNGTLTGDLMIKGSGDPTISYRFQDEEGNIRAFKTWISDLKKSGIREIRGNIIGDDNCFDENELGSGWEVDDLQGSYAAPIGGLSFNENNIQVIAQPASTAEEPLVILTEPVKEFLNIRNNTTTLNTSERSAISINRLIGTNDVQIRGNAPVNGRNIRRTISIHNPTMYLLSAFKENLAENGISLTGELIDIDEITVYDGFYDDWRVISTDMSPKLSEIIKPLNKNSNNFMAEQLFRTTGYHLSGLGSAGNGAIAVKGILSDIGVINENIKIYDGSGLSRHSLVTPFQITSILKYMRNHRSYDVFYNSLPVAGVDGTISSRMKNTSAENVVHAKTGTIEFVRALSGYVKSLENEEFIVSILINHYTEPSSVSSQIQDRLYILLANFKRNR
ncbi:D-alanyl-D-alanine carboxypeptidase/D-alanyl-D-alanine-endopeptidase [candidate division KSB1 bacterium]